MAANILIYASTTDRRVRVAMFDALSIASALRAGSETLWSEDMQDGMVIDSRIRNSNPFRTGS